MSKAKYSAPRSRSFSLITYLSEGDIRLVIEKERDRIYHYAYILHDRDVNELGQIKEPHWHVVIRTYFQCSPSTIVRWFKRVCSDQNTLGQCVISEPDIRDYLMHDASPDKAQYTEDEIHSDDWGWFKGSFGNGDAFECLSLMLDGMPFMELAKIYGREFIINHRNYINLAMLLKSNQNNANANLDSYIAAFNEREDLL